MEGQQFKIVVHGCATHGATPQLGADAIVAASKVIEALQTIVSRSANPLDEISVVVGSVQSGTQFNIIADTAILKGQTYASGQELLLWAQKEIERIASHTAEALKCAVEVKFDQETA